MSQEHVGYPYDFAKDDPIDQFWAAHGPRSYPLQTAFDWFDQRDIAKDPWCNGRYALAALVWGLFIMLVVSVMA
jgi:hypothetical protein